MASLKTLENFSWNMSEIMSPQTPLIFVDTVGQSCNYYYHKGIKQRSIRKVDHNFTSFFRENSWSASCKKTGQYSHSFRASLICRDVYQKWLFALGAKRFERLRSSWIMQKLAQKLPLLEKVHNDFHFKALKAGRCLALTDHIFSWKIAMAFAHKIISLSVNLLSVETCRKPQEFPVLSMGAKLVAPTPIEFFSGIKECQKICADREQRREKSWNIYDSSSLPLPRS